METQSLFKEFKNLFSEKEDLEKKSQKEKDYLYSPFALQDAVGARDIKKTWLEYQKLLLQGIQPEELIHKIISKVKDMAAISKGATATDLGIKDFPYNKSKKDLKNWKKEDLENFYTKLVSIYHKSRMGGESLDTALEKTLLEL